MAYKGYLVKVGDYKIPHGMIKADNYSAYISMQTVDPWTDADGELHFDAVELKALKVEFETVPQLTHETLENFMKNIRNQYVVSKDRKLYITAYIPETGTYETQFGYVADMTPSIYFADDNTIKYNSVRLALIGGVAK